MCAPIGKNAATGIRAVRELATLAAHAPAGPEWLHEIKYDGYVSSCGFRMAPCPC
jgi:hypothetical protein